MTQRAHDNGPFKEFDFGQWFAENMRGCRKERHFDPDEIFGEKFGRHVRNAWKEQLLAARDVIDAAIERLEKMEPPRQA